MAQTGIYQHPHMIYDIGQHHICFRVSPSSFRVTLGQSDRAAGDEEDIIDIADHLVVREESVYKTIAVSCCLSATIQRLCVYSIPGIISQLLAVCLLDAAIYVHSSACFLQHPGYQPAAAGTPNDICILTLSRDAQFNEYVQAGDMADTYEDFAGYNCYISGWGKLSEWSLLLDASENLELKGTPLYCRWCRHFIGMNWGGDGGG